MTAPVADEEVAGNVDMWYGGSVKGSTSGTSNANEKFNVNETVVMESVWRRSARAIRAPVDWLTTQRRRFIKTWVSTLRNISDLGFDNPFKLIISFALIVLIFSSGFYFCNVEDNVYRMYAMPHSEAHNNHDVISELFPERYCTFFAFASKDESNIFKNRVTFSSLQRLENFIKTTLVVPVYNPVNQNGRRMFSFLNEVADTVVNHVSFQDVCEVRRGRTDEHKSQVFGLNNIENVEEVVHPFMDCVVESPFDMWPRKRYGMPVVTKYWPYVVSPMNGTVLKIDFLLLNPELQPNMQRTAMRVNGASGIVTMLYMDSSRENEVQAFDDALIGIQKDLSKAMAALQLLDHEESMMPVIMLNKYGAVVEYDWYPTVNGSVDVTNLPGHELMLTLTNLDIGISTKSSWESELSRSTSFNTRLCLDYLMSLSILIGYGVLATSTRDIYRTKWWVGAAGAISALIGYIGGAGFCYLCGVKHTATMNAVPFLAMGIGMDDAFVMINSYSLTYFIVPSNDGDRKEALNVARERCRVALGDGAMAITLTTATNIVSFAVGAANPYMAVRNFCILAVAGLMGGYIACLFFFWPIMCLSAKMEALRISSIPFYKILVNRVIFKDYGANEGDTVFKTKKFQNISSMVGHLVKLQVSYLRIKTQIIFLEGISIGKKWGLINPEFLQRVATNESYDELVQVSRGGSFSLKSWYKSKYLLFQHYSMELLVEFRANLKAVYEKYTPPRGNPMYFSQYISVRAIYVFMRYKSMWYGIIAAFMGIAVVMSVALWRRFSLGLDQIALVPHDSYLRDMYGISDKHEIYFLPAKLMINFTDESKANWGDRDVQDAVSALITNLESREATNSVVSPLELFYSWLNSGDHYGEWYDTEELTVFKGEWKDGEFEDALYYWNHEVFMGTFMDNQMKWKLLPGQRNRYKLEALVVIYFNKFYSDTTEQAKAFYSFRNHLGDFRDNNNLGLTAREFSSHHPFFESDQKIIFQTLSSMASALAGIFIVTILFMDDHRLWSKYQLIVVVIVVFMDLTVFGMMSILGLQLNIITLIQLVMSIGFSVDYSLHMTHQYSSGYQGTVVEKLSSSMIIIGTPLLNSFISTIGSSMPLAARLDEYIYGTFFRMTVLVLVIGVVYGFALLPALLAISDRGNVTVRSLEEIVNEDNDKVDVESLSSTIVQVVDI